ISCESNVKQMATALLMYKADNEDHLPFFQWDTHRIPGGSKAADNIAKPWHQAAYDYIGDVKSFQCPRNQKKNGSIYGWYIDNWNANKGAGSKVYPNYGYNEYGMSRSWKMTQLKWPSESLELADCANGLIGNCNTNWGSGGGLTPQGYFYRICTSLSGGCSYEGEYENSVTQNGGVNLEFFDGHVEFRNWKSVRCYAWGGNLRYHDNDVK
ncbi:MAG: hypothetical protein IKX48_07950, partial [Victivallales bacterium]|nr:hypothetical protein [Victivallales bacterium]